jgi:hypothetical protein
VFPVRYGQTYRLRYRVHQLLYQYQFPLVPYIFENSMLRMHIVFTPLLLSSERYCLMVSTLLSDLNLYQEGGLIPIITPKYFQINNKFFL